MIKFTQMIVKVTLSVLVSLGLAKVLSLLLGYQFPSMMMLLCGVWLLLGYLKYSKNKDGFVIGTGIHQNPMSSSSSASLNTRVESDERSVNLDRINNTFHYKSFFNRMFIQKSVSEMFVTGIILWVIAYNLYLL